MKLVETVCTDCGQSLYFSGCPSPHCTGYTCTECGTGCDLDFAEYGECRRALAEGR